MGRFLKDVAHGARREWIRWRSWKSLCGVPFNGRRREAVKVYCRANLPEKAALLKPWLNSPGSAVWVPEAWYEKLVNACLAWRSLENRSKQDIHFIYLLFETWKTSSSSNSISDSDPSRAALWSCLSGKDEKIFRYNYKPLVSSSGGINTMPGGIWGTGVPFPRSL